MGLQQVIGNLATEQRRAVLTWLTKSGPFWDDVRWHGADDWLECRGEVVTDTAVGEAAWRCCHGVECGLVSLAPSEWCHSPLRVTWVREAEGLGDRNVAVQNWWCEEVLGAALGSQTPLGSWDDLRDASRNRFAGLVFAEDCFAPLAGVPFAKSAADRFVVLLGVLDRLANAFGDDGVRDAEGHRILQSHFAGERSLFSDSSASEKREFEHELTFAHPDDPAASLFCTWHGKISHLTLRLHFSWPVEAGRPVYVVYAGPKITKR